eukprot:TRINITY_DN2125_c0_g1_i2.p1 TRINITY_DN2125_c0_g1~~TRINITY_DN2125_c0_g1_i2.p1  ORF type:complete len:651 (+),score=162.85 TRINITY_DN2125_c0_g1_i2:541-2493(+)
MFTQSTMLTRDRGSPVFMSPQIHEASTMKYTAKTDVWSLGLIVAHLCTNLDIPACTEFSQLPLDSLEKQFPQHAAEIQGFRLKAGAAMCNLVHRRRRAIEFLASRNDCIRERFEKCLTFFEEDRLSSQELATSLDACCPVCFAGGCITQLYRPHMEEFVLRCKKQQSSMSEHGEEQELSVLIDHWRDGNHTAECNRVHTEEHARCVLAALSAGDAATAAGLLSQQRKCYRQPEWPPVHAALFLLQLACPTAVPWRLTFRSCVHCLARTPLAEVELLRQRLVQPDFVSCSLSCSSMPELPPGGSPPGVVPGDIVAAFVMLCCSSTELRAAGLTLLEQNAARVPCASVLLGLCLLQAQEDGPGAAPPGIRADRALALQLFLSTAERTNNAAAHSLAALCFAHGLGSERDAAAAERHARAAHASGASCGARALAFVLQHGGVGPPRVQEARALLERACAQGDSDAHWMLGRLCENVGRPRDAPAWFRIAADNDNACGLWRLGLSCERGLTNAGGEPDWPAAVKYYRRAAEQGDPCGMLGLGACYRRGVDGVLSQDPRAAVEYFTRAADQGLARAQVTLAECFADGVRGVVAQDLGRAVELLTLAEQQGDPHARTALQALGKKTKHLPNLAHLRHRPPQSQQPQQPFLRWLFDL